MPYNDAKTEPILEKIVEGMRRLCTVKATFPLGDPNLKLVHTNSFVFCHLIHDNTTLSNFEAISTLLQHTYTRYTHYEKDKWYVEAVTITNNKSKYEMELTLNPMASPLKSYQKDFNKFTQDYLKAKEQADKQSGTSSTKSVKAVKTATKSNATTKSGEPSDIVTLVNKIIKGKKTDYQKCKAIHEWLSKNVKYSRYKDSKYSSVMAAYNNRKHLNCADTSRLTRSMMSAAGLKAYVVHSTCHYYTVIEINGKQYCSDATSNKRNKLNLYWKATSCYNGWTAKFTGKKCYDKKCGNNPCS